MYEYISLEPEQQELLSLIVEAARNVPRAERRPFRFLVHMNGTILFHPGLGGDVHNIYEGDIQTLIRAKFIALSQPADGSYFFDVTPRGFRYYEEMKKRQGQPVQRIENALKQYLNSDRFQRKYPQAFQKWAEAESLLWISDSEVQLTTLGHLCREAIQAFATALVEQFQPPGVDQDKAHTIARINIRFDLYLDNCIIRVQPGAATEMRSRRPSRQRRFAALKRAQVDSIRRCWSA